MTFYNTIHVYYIGKILIEHREVKSAQTLLHADTTILLQYYILYVLYCI